MFFTFYQTCPLCGCLHDDGGFAVCGGKRMYLCLDCLDGLSEAADSSSDKESPSDVSV